MTGMNEHSIIIATMSKHPSEDLLTAERFAQSWNHVYDASVYTDEQAREWFEPWTAGDVNGQEVLELGCGSGALLHHLHAYQPARLVGVDLGDSVQRAKALLKDRAEILQMDITDLNSLQASLPAFDRVYSIGVLHHLKHPEKGVESLIQMTKPGGYFHGWVYAHEGNALVRIGVEPIRKLASRLPWPITKYGLALPLSVPFYIYAKFCSIFKKFPPFHFLPMFNYMLWIGKRGFAFHHHVAFDQLVTPQTTFIPKSLVKSWLQHPLIEQDSTYIIFRNGNGWKFGGRRRPD